MTQRRSVFPLPGIVVALAFLTACTHSDSYTFTAPVINSFPGGTDVQLTYNVDQDYWPAWTEDGKAILYAYVDEQFPQHRCLGLLNPAGGTRLWSLCDNRAVRRDTLSSYSAFALDTAGRLLVAEVVALNSLTPLLPLATLWLADTANPYQRTELLRLPIQTADGSVSWLSDLRWTSPTTFMALGQTFGTATEVGEPTDTVFTDGGVIVEGTIGSVFIEAAGLSCKGSVCLVAEDRILTNGVYSNSPVNLCPTSAAVCQEFGLIWDSPPAPLLPHALHRISLSTGADDVVANGGQTFATPVISPVNNDVLVQVGGMWGHLQTRASVSVNSNLHVMHGLLP